MVALANAIASLLPHADLASRTITLSVFPLKNLLRLCFAFPQQPLPLHPPLIVCQKPPSPPHQLGLHHVSSNTRRALSFAQEYPRWNLDSVARHSLDTPSVRGPRGPTAASFPIDGSSAFLLLVDAT